MRRRATVIALVAAPVAVGAAGAWLLLTPPAMPGPLIDGDDAALVALGREFYAAQCASCHGADLEGQPDWQRRSPDGLLPAPPHDESGHTWHHPDAVLFELTKYGPAAFAGEGYVSAMQAFEGILTDQEIIAVLAFIKSTWPPEIRARQADVNAHAAELP
jgi:mono/diheme cytochrome c family protein